MKNCYARLCLIIALFLIASCRQMHEELLPEEEPPIPYETTLAFGEEFLIKPERIEIAVMANGNYPGLFNGRFIKDISGLNSGYCHPDVQYFPDGFRGYKYWMVFTPYFGSVGFDFYARRFENPTIVVSHDGIHWEEPSGIWNPIQQSPSFKESFLEKKGELVQGFWSDVDWVYRNSRFELYYRGSCISASALKKRGASSENNRHKLRQNAQRTIVRQTSTDGVNWSPLEVAYTSTPPSSAKDDFILSPAFIEVAGETISYEVEINKAQKTFKTEDCSIVVQRKSMNGLDFSNLKHSKAVNFLNKPWLTKNPNHGVWHINANYVDGFYVLVLAVGDVKKYTSDLLYFAYSLDGINFVVDPTSVMDELAYRSALFPKTSNDQIIDFGVILGKKDGQFHYTELRVKKSSIRHAFHQLNDKK